MKHVVVCTSDRVVVMGEVSDDTPIEVPADGRMVLRNARMAVYYSADTRGEIGLATRGPQPGSNVSPAVDEIGIANVRSVVPASEEAVAAWEAEPWGR